MVLYGSWARRLVGPDYPWGLRAAELEGFLGSMGRAWATGEWWDEGHPSPFDDERHRQWWARYLRMAASPAMAQAVIRMNTQMDGPIRFRVPLRLLRFFLSLSKMLADSGLLDYPRGMKRILGISLALTLLGD